MLSIAPVAVTGLPRVVQLLELKSELPQRHRFRKPSIGKAGMNSSREWGAH